MPTKIDPSTLQIGNGKLGQDTVSVSALDFPGLVDANALIKGHINNPTGAHKASAISVQDILNKYRGIDVETVLAELSDLVPDLPNVVGQRKENTPNTGVPTWTNIDTSQKTGAFTCSASDHKHQSWLGATFVPPTIAESHCLIPSSVLNFSISGNLFPADKGVLVLMYTPKGGLDHSNEVVVAKLDLGYIWLETNRRTSQVDYTASEGGVDKISLTHRVPVLELYPFGVPFAPYSYTFYDFQIARFSISSADISAYGADAGSFYLIHFKQFSDPAGSNYDPSNIYGQSIKYDLYRDPSSGASPVTNAVYRVRTSDDVGTKSQSVFTVNLTGINEIVLPSGYFSLIDGNSTGWKFIISGSAPGKNNNGTYQVLRANSATHAYVTPNWHSTETGVTATFPATTLMQMSGIYHYNAGNGFSLDFNTINNEWSNSYLTSTIASTGLVSEGYECANDPITADLSKFGSANQDVPYYELDSVGMRGPFDLIATHGPTAIQDAGYYGPFIAGSNGEVASLASSAVTARNPFSSNTASITHISTKPILIDTATQLITTRQNVEDFSSEIERYRSFGNFDSVVYNYPLSPIANIDHNGNHGHCTVNRQLSTSGDGYSSWDTTGESDLGKLVVISNCVTSANNGQYYVSAVISGSIIELTRINPVLPSLTSPDAGAGAGIIWKVYGKKFDSTIDLNNYPLSDELQVIGGQLIYPQSNFATTAIPSGDGATIVQPNYATLYSADSSNTIRYYTRLFNTGSPQNTGKLRIVGIQPSDLFATGYSPTDLVSSHPGGVIVLVKVPGAYGMLGSVPGSNNKWLDLGLMYGSPNLTTQGNYYGCRVMAEGSGADWTYSFYTDVYTDEGAVGEYPLAVKVGIVKTASSKSISRIEWLPETISDEPLEDSNAIKLQGRDIAPTAPTDNQILRWDAITNQWEPSDEVITVTAENLGSGENVFVQEVSGDLQFKTLVADTNMTITSTPTEIHFASTGGGGGGRGVLSLTDPPNITATQIRANAKIIVTSTTPASYPTINGSTVTGPFDLSAVTLNILTDIGSATILPTDWSPIPSIMSLQNVADTINRVVGASYSIIATAVITSPPNTGYIQLVRTLYGPTYYLQISPAISAIGFTDTTQHHGTGEYINLADLLLSDKGLDLMICAPASSETYAIALNYGLNLFLLHAQHNLAVLCWTGTDWSVK